MSGRSIRGRIAMYGFADEAVHQHHFPFDANLAVSLL
jgi:hypothetical protein